MNELEKISRVLKKLNPNTPHEVLLVLDATTGQNALSQAKQFSLTSGVTGIVLTKLDGTAKGGVTIAINQEMDIPVKFIGLGEQKEDLEVFDPEEFVNTIFE
jgi:fused signal recognition particle receptor